MFWAGETSRRCGREACATVRCAAKTSEVLVKRAPLCLLIACVVLGLVGGGCKSSPSASYNPRLPYVSNKKIPHNYARWEKEIAAYEAADTINRPPKGGILFVGSSTIRLWKTLEQDFPKHKVINRGFGGCEIADVTYYADRIVVPYEPKQIFLRAGGNDIHNGRLPPEVAGDFVAFVKKVHRRLPNTEIIFISLSPAPSR